MIFIGGLFLISCRNNFYMPTKHNVLPFNEKGDMIINGDVGMYENFSLEAGYSLTNNFGLITRLNCMDISIQNNSKYLLNDYIWDNELVLYKQIKKSLFTGLNLGIGFGLLGKYNPNYNYNLNRQYILPWLVIKNDFQTDQDKYFLKGFSVKISRLDYNLNTQLDISTEYDKQVFYHYFQIEDLVKNVFIIEPGITFGVNLSKIRISLQGQLVFYPLKQSNKIPVNMELSVSVYLNKLFSKKPIMK